MKIRPNGDSKLRGLDATLARFALRAGENMVQEFVGKVGKQDLSNKDILSLLFRS